MPIFRKSSLDPHALTIALTGVKMGDRLLQIGSHDRTLVGVLAGKVGLSGTAALVVFDGGQADRAQKAAAQAGVLTEIQVAKAGSFPFDTGSFDLAVVDETAGLLAGLKPEDRVGALQETFRVLTEAGRVVVIEATERGGLGALWSRSSADPHFVGSGGMVTALQAEGFRSVRVLAEREGRRFTEGIKPRSGT
jgi:ubiquinone/menaquinone biosynthesis C-methylase UbiE